ncbi:unnamed protein product [Nezara viridula]|uniref:Neuropeptide n=1 Tax=Nezara viridula TaxID=85310 RepID=A0A9P0MR01_NEZVI|nr:unnamed protein product [Nezara viridula]
MKVLLITLFLMGFICSVLPAPVDLREVAETLKDVLFDAVFPKKQSESEQTGVRKPEDMPEGAFEHLFRGNSGPQYPPHKTEDEPYYY